MGRGKWPHTYLPVWQFLLLHTQSWCLSSMSNPDHWNMKFILWKARIQVSTELMNKMSNLTGISGSYHLFNMVIPLNMLFFHQVLGKQLFNLCACKAVPFHHSQLASLKRKTLVCQFTKNISQSSESNIEPWINQLFVTVISHWISIITGFSHSVFIQQSEVPQNSIHSLVPWHPSHIIQRLEWQSIFIKNLC